LSIYLFPDFFMGFTEFITFPFAQLLLDVVADFVPVFFSDAPFYQLETPDDCFFARLTGFVYANRKD